MPSTTTILFSFFFFLSFAFAVDPVQLLVPVDSSGSIAYTDTFTARPGGANNAVDPIDGVAVQLSLGSSFTFMLAEEVPADARVIFRLFVGDLDGPGDAGLLVQFTDHEGATIYNYAYTGWQCGSTDVALDMSGFNTTSLTLSIVDYAGTLLKSNKGAAMSSFTSGYLSLSMGYKVYELNKRADNGVFYLDMTTNSSYVVQSTSVTYNNKQPVATTSLPTASLLAGEWMEVGREIELNVTDITTGMSRPVMQFEFFVGAPNSQVSVQVRDSDGGRSLNSMVTDSAAASPISLLIDVPLNPNTTTVTLYADYDSFTLLHFAEIYDLDEANMYESRVAVADFKSSDSAVDTYADVIDASNCSNDFLRNDDFTDLSHGTMLSMCTDLDDVANYFPIPTMVGSYGNTIADWLAFPRSNGASTPVYVFLATAAQQMAGENVTSLMSSGAVAILSNVTYTRELEYSGATQTNRPVRMIANLGQVDVDTYPYLVIGQLGESLDHFLGTAIRFYNAPEFSQSASPSPSPSPSPAVTPSSSMSTGATPSQTPTPASPSTTPTDDASSSIMIASTLSLSVAVLISVLML